MTRTRGGHPRPDSLVAPEVTINPDDNSYGEKDALDSNGIHNPGNAGIWPARLRGQDL